MHQIPLFSKLAMTQSGAADTSGSVLRHLRRLLNTRRGEALCNAEYGLIDLVDLLADLPHTAEQIGQSIEQCIRQFEPRLMVHAVSLEHDAPQCTLRYVIAASLIDDARRGRCGASVQLQAQLGPHGHIEVAL